MWTEYGWLVWVVMGGAFLWLMMRSGGCCGGHRNAAGHEGHGGHGNPSETPAAGGDAQKRSHGGCH